MKPTLIQHAIWMAYGRTPLKFYAAHWVMVAQRRAERLAMRDKR